MHRKHTRRLFAAVVTAAALAVPASVAAVGIVPVGTAYASGISCTGLKLSGTLASGTLTISKCTPSAGKGYKDATASTTVLASGSGNLTWSNSHATTTVSITPTAGTQGPCKKGYVEYFATGSVTAASTSGVGIPAVGDSVNASVCIDILKNKLALAPGTSFSL